MVTDDDDDDDDDNATVVALKVGMQHGILYDETLHITVYRPNGQSDLEDL